jgi:hypothetical protein
MLRGARWWFVGGVSEQPVSPTFKRLKMLDPQTETHKLSRNVANKPATYIAQRNSG